MNSRISKLQHTIAKVVQRYTSKEQNKNQGGKGLYHTFTKQSWKKSRRMDAPILGSLSTACAMAKRTMLCTFGQLLA